MPPADISDKSKVTLGIVITLLGLAFWVGSVHSMTVTNGRDIDKVAIARIEADRRLADRLREDEQTFSDVVGRLSRIEGQVQYIYDAERDRAAKKR